jgi:hypothetical protein
MVVVLGQGHHVALACNLQAATAGHLQKLFRFLSDRFTYKCWQCFCLKEGQGFA